MDILKPELVWIEGRCYRIPSINEYDSTKNNEDIEETVNGHEFDSVACIAEDEYDDYEIERIENGRFRTAFHVPHVYYSYIIGAKGCTRRRLEDETRTQIRIPKQGQMGDIVITGQNERGVAAARRRINLILVSFRQKQQATHFLSIPMNGAQIKKGFLTFKERVLEQCKDHRIDESVFQSPEKLHLTLGTLVLADNEERSQVAEMLMNFKETIMNPMLNNKSIKLHMMGVEYMNDDPSEVNVLYGKVQLVGCSNVDLLQNLADSLMNFSVKTGFMTKQYERVKLHVTLMNTRYRRNQGDDDAETEKSSQKKRSQETFDATTILQMFENFDFGEHIVNGIHLSQRFTTSTDGYYQMSANIAFA